MNIALFTPQGSHCHADVIYLLPGINWELRREHGVYGTLSKAYTRSVLDELQRKIRHYIVPRAQVFKKST